MRILAFLIVLIHLAASAVPSSASAQTKNLLTVWTFLNPAGTDGREVALRKLIEKFMRDNPGVEIKVEPQVWSQLSQKFVLGRSTGRTADVVFLLTQDLAFVAKSGAAADLEPLLFKSWSQADRDDFLFPKMIDAARLQGRVIGVPIFVFAPVLFYRKDLLAEAGLSEKDFGTWSGFGSALMRLQTPSMRGFTLPLGPDRATQSPVVTQLLQAQGLLFDSDCKAQFATPAGVEALKAETAMFAGNGLVSREDVSRNLDDASDVFASGRAAAMINASTRYEQFRSKATWGMTGLGVAGLPSATGEGYGPSIASAWYLAVAERSPNKELAGRLVEYLVGVDGARAWAVDGFQVPLRRTVANDPALAGTEFEPLKKIFQIIERAGVSLPNECQFGRMYSDFNLAAQRVVVSGSDPMTALKEAEQTFNARN